MYHRWRYYIHILYLYENMFAVIAQPLIFASPFFLMRYISILLHQTSAHTLFSRKCIRAHAAHRVSFIFSLCLVEYGQGKKILYMKTRYAFIRTLKCRRLRCACETDGWPSPSPGRAEGA